MYLHLNVENFDPLDDEHLDNEDLDQADETEIIYETCTFLYWYEGKCDKYVIVILSLFLWMNFWTHRVLSLHRKNELH